MMRLRGCLDRIDRNFDIAIGTVFKADWTRQAGRQLAMDLRFCGAGTNGTPADQVSNILRADHIEKFRTGRQAKFIDIQQQFTRNTQAIIDAEAVIHVRIINQALPADGGARFFEIHAHNNF